MVIRLLVVGLLLAHTGCRTFHVEDLELHRSSDQIDLPLELEIDRESLLVAVSEGTYRLRIEASGEELFDIGVPVGRAGRGLSLEQIRAAPDGAARERWNREAVEIRRSPYQVVSNGFTARGWSFDPRDEDLADTAEWRDESAVVFSATWRGPDLSGVLETSTQDWQIGFSFDGSPPPIRAGGIRQESVGALPYSATRDLVFAHDHAVENVHRLLARESSRLLADGPTRGSLVVRLPKRRDHWAHRGWIVPSVLTLFTINFIGFPVGHQTCRLEVALEVRDASGRLIGEYVGIGDTTEYSAAYWGYSLVGAGTAHTYHPLSRAVIATATLDGLQQAVNALRVDLPRIRRELGVEGA